MSYGFNRPVQCNKGVSEGKQSCGTMIRFDKNVTSQSGKVIPLDANTGEPHQCPNNTYNQKNKNFPTKQDTQELHRELREESNKQLKFADHAEQIDQLLQQIVLEQEAQGKGIIAAHSKLDKVLEALTITTKAEFNKAADLKTDNATKKENITTGPIDNLEDRQPVKRDSEGYFLDDEGMRLPDIIQQGFQVGRFAEEKDFSGEGDGLDAVS